MNSHIELKYKKDKMENYISEILTMELCKLFFPVNFIHEENEVTGIYKTEGFRNIAAIHHICTEDILNIIISLLHGMCDGEKRYIFFDEYDINAETVFTDPGYTTTKMIYVPSKEEKTGPEKILEFFQVLKEKGNEEGVHYIENATEFIKDNRFSYTTIIHHLEMLRKEVYLCGIE